MNIGQRWKEFVRLTREVRALSGVARLVGRSADTVGSDREPMGVADSDPVSNRESAPDLQDAIAPREQVDAPTVSLFHSTTSDEVVAALARGSSVSDTDEQGRTALHHARNGGVVRALVAAGAVVDARDIEGNIPAHTAHEDAMSELIEGVGKDVHQALVENNHGQTAYETRDYFYRERYEDAYWEDLYDREQAERQARDKEEQDYVLNIVALIEAGDAKKLLEQVGPNAELVSGNRSYNIDGDEGWAYNEYAGYSVLHEAAKVGNVQLCRELVFAGADWDKECRLMGEQGFDNYVNGFRNEPGSKPIDFAWDNETRDFLKNAEQELRAHNLSKRLDEIYPSADSWKPPVGGFAAEAQRQVAAALKVEGQDTQVQEKPRLRARL